MCMCVCVYVCMCIRQAKENHNGNNVAFKARAYTEELPSPPKKMPTPHSHSLEPLTRSCMAHMILPGQCGGP